MNELAHDDAWQRSVIERLLTPVLRAQAFQGQVYFFGCNSQVTRLLQMRAHVDAIVPLSNGGDISLEVKLRRWPGVKSGPPRRYGWSDVFLETFSCSIPGSEAQGWLFTCQAEFLLYCFCSAREDKIDCYPFFLPRLRRWFFHHKDQLREQRVPNPINGRNLWSVGKLAPISKICRELKVEGFRIDAGGLICDLYGEPILGFLKEPARQ